MVTIGFVGVATFDRPGKGATSILQSVSWRTSFNVLSTRLGEYRYHGGTMVQKGSRVTAIYDIHGNLPALEAVLAKLESVKPDLIVVGGDVVAGPMPAEVLDRLVTLGEHIWTSVDDKVGKPKIGKPGHWRRLGPISDQKQTELLWVWPEQWDYERYAPTPR